MLHSYVNTCQKKPVGSKALPSWFYFSILFRLIIRLQVAQIRLIFLTCRVHLSKTSNSKSTWHRIRVNFKALLCTVFISQTGDAPTELSVEGGRIAENSNSNGGRFWKFPIQSTHCTFWKFPSQRYRENGYCLTQTWKTCTKFRKLVKVNVPIIAQLVLEEP